MTDRSRLPNRRECVRYEFPHGGFRYVATIGILPEDGQPGELFLHAAKAGTSVEAAARDAAISTSLLMQFGCQIDTLRHALTRGEANEAAGPVARALDILSDELPITVVPVQIAVGVRE